MGPTNNSRQSIVKRDNYNTYSVQNRFDEYGMNILDIFWQEFFEPVLRAGAGKLRKIAVSNIETSTFGLTKNENTKELEETDALDYDCKELH